MCAHDILHFIYQLEETWNSDQVSLILINVSHVDIQQGKVLASPKDCLRKSLVRLSYGTIRGDGIHHPV